MYRSQCRAYGVLGVERVSDLPVADGCFSSHLAKGVGRKIGQE